MVYICNYGTFCNYGRQQPMSEKEAQLHPVIAVRVKPDLYAWADETGARG